jgi:hypothetical protein
MSNKDSLKSIYETLQQDNDNTSALLYASLILYSYYNRPNIYYNRIKKILENESIETILRPFLTQDDLTYLDNIKQGIPDLNIDEIITDENNILP